MKTFLKHERDLGAFTPALVKLCPPRFERYVEPCLTTGSLFFALEPSSAKLSCASFASAVCWTGVLEDPSMVAAQLEEFEPNRQCFGEMKEAFSLTMETTSLSAWVIAMSEMAVRHRVSTLASRQNPMEWGGYRNLKWPTESTLLDAQILLRNAGVEAVSFPPIDLSDNSIGQGDFVVLDLDQLTPDVDVVTSLQGKAHVMALSLGGPPRDDFKRFIHLTGTIPKPTYGQVTHATRALCVYRNYDDSGRIL